MKSLILAAILAIVSSGAACGAKTESATPTKTDSAATENKKGATTTTSEASTIVMEIYDEAMRRNCSAIPAKLTEDFRKAVGTSKDELDALCDTFTDSGKLAGFEIKSEDLKGDSGKVKVALTFKDGKKEDKDENVRKSADGKWLMDS